MKQKSSQVRILRKNKSQKKTENHRRYSNNSFISVECPYCESVGAHLFWSQHDTIGHCQDCSRNWVEYQGMVWTF